MLVNLIVVFLLTLLETVPFVLDQLWTQASHICSIVSERKLGPYIDRGRSNTKVSISQLLTSEGSPLKGRTPSLYFDQVLPVR